MRKRNKLYESLMKVKQVISLLKCNLIFSRNEIDRKSCRKSRRGFVLKIYEMEMDFELSYDHLGNTKLILIPLILWKDSRSQYYCIYVCVTQSIHSSHLFFNKIVHSSPLLFSKSVHSSPVLFSRTA